MMMDENVANVLLLLFYYFILFYYHCPKWTVISPKTSSEAQLVGRELHPVMGDEGVLVTELGC